MLCLSRLFLGEEIVVVATKTRIGGRAVLSVPTSTLRSHFTALHSGTSVRSLPSTSAALEKLKRESPSPLLDGRLRLNHVAAATCTWIHYQVLTVQNYSHLHILRPTSVRQMAKFYKAFRNIATFPERGALPGTALGGGWWDRRKNAAKPLVQTPESRGFILIRLREEVMQCA